jgi:oleandomycin transport system ATP-binding protein
VQAAVAGFAQADPEVRGSTVTVPATGEHVMPAVVRRLEDQDIAVAELTLRGSTLDEVFLSLTGRRPEDKHEEETAGELEGSAA